MVEVTDMPGTDDILLARRAVKETLTPKSHMRCNCRAEIDAGEWDRGHKIRAVLYAIRALKGPSNG